MSSPARLIASLYPSRNRILWLGEDVPLSLEAECISRAMRIAAHTDDLTNDVLSQVRGVVIPISTDTRTDDVTAILRRARAHGIVIGLAMRDDNAFGQYAALASAIVGSDADRIFAKYQNWRDFAHEIDRHEPGPGFSQVELLGDTDDLSDEGRLLIQRSFSDVQSLTLSSLNPGKSGAGVWRVTATGKGAENAPHQLLVKVGPLAKIREEQAKYVEFIERRGHWLHIPRLISERFAEGNELGLLVQTFADEALPLSRALELVAAGPVIANLFDVALHGCHGSDSAVGQLGKEFVDLKVLKWDRAALTASATAALTLSKCALPVEKLRALWDSFPNVSYRRGIVHADLHVGNLFARANSSDVLVIDFTNAAYGPVVADHACLEVSFVFPTLEENAVTEELSQDRLAKLYEHPLPINGFFNASSGPTSLLSRIRAVRRAAVTTETNQSVYSLAVAAYLLRFSSFDDQDLGRRAAAYAAACQLVQSVAAQSIKK